MSYRDRVGWRSGPLTLTSVPCILCVAVTATAVSYRGMARRLAGNMGECCWWGSPRKIWRWHIYGRSVHNNRQLFLRKTAMVTNNNDHCNLVQGCLPYELQPQRRVAWVCCKCGRVLPPQRKRQEVPIYNLFLYTMNKRAGRVKLWSCTLNGTYAFLPARRKWPR
jgi:hypothetical protein